MSDASVTGVLRERASLQPDDTAFTFVDYDQEWGGVPHALSWSQLNRRVQSLAHELRQHAAPGDRAVITAPQGLDYVVAFLGSLQAGVIGVPLSTPMVGVHDERITAVLRDASPTVILTTTAVAGTVGEYAVAQDGQPAPSILEVDSLDLDSRRKRINDREPRPATAYLQYTSGSTRTPAGVMVSNRNLTANFEQVTADFFPDFGKVSPPNTTAVSWLPFYHDMGLMLGLCAPILGGWHSVFTTPASFLVRPARWMQLLADKPHTVTAAPNFAFELAAGRTSDDDMAGKDLGGVLRVLSGSERVHVATLRRFASRFAKFNLKEESLKPSYGLAEATLYVATRRQVEPPNVVEFEPEKLSAGHAKRCGTESGTPLVSYGAPESPVVRIVDPQSKMECPAEMVGEIWVQGENVCLGYWNRPQPTEDTFGASIVDPSAGTPEGPWLRTGDLGFISEGELFIVGRIKDILIVRGLNHYPDDIEATVQEISGGRTAAIAVEEESAEQLVVLVEVKNRASQEEARERLAALKREVTSAISNAHGLSVADIVAVPRGALPITTSGKIRRASCAEMYRNNQFSRLG
ncbi:AMP-binding protein [Mycobacterium deserti]|uniref:AMP-binding protein n=1 Tax=Mycobacterium deserti TaxID=2978347 RepID=A0ABT2M535_9MYCO|nr:AMP-binding protein [Mycobacterium deserti]MCT7657367.1 AMP-binding protein [Mycobacterium deserti]